jgi:hypothetical protein
MTRYDVIIDFKGYANQRCYEMFLQAVRKLKAASDSEMVLLVTLNAARALAAQNEFQVNIFEQIRHNFPHLTVVLSSCEMNDPNTANLRLKE